MSFNLAALSRGNCPDPAIIEYRNYIGSDITSLRLSQKYIALFAGKFDGPWSKKISGYRKFEDCCVSWLPAITINRTNHLIRNDNIFLSTFATRSKVACKRFRFSLPALQIALIAPSKSFHRIAICSYRRDVSPPKKAQIHCRLRRLSPLLSTGSSYLTNK